MPRETKQQVIDQQQLEIKHLKAKLRKIINVVRKHCYRCCGNSITEAKRCGMKPKYEKRTLVDGCALYPYQPRFEKEWQAVYA